MDNMRYSFSARLVSMGKDICLYTTSPQFKNAIPVVSIHSYVDYDDLSDIAERYSGQISLTSTNTLDDIDNLDDLIADDIDIDDIDIEEFDFMDDFDLEDL